jgi:hypothetical protein
MTADQVYGFHKFDKISPAHLFSPKSNFLSAVSEFVTVLVYSADMRMKEY